MWISEDLLFFLLIKAVNVTSKLKLGVKMEISLLLSSIIVSLLDTYHFMSPKFQGSNILWKQRVCKGAQIDGHMSTCRILVDGSIDPSTTMTLDKHVVAQTVYYCQLVSWNKSHPQEPSIFSHSVQANERLDLSTEGCFSSLILVS